MSATLAPHAHPTHALLCWVDDTYVYVEIPTKLGSPLVEKFALTDGGLGKALNFLRHRYEELPTAEKNYTALPSGYVCQSLTNAKPTYRAQNKKIQTDEQRTMALNVLRKLGIV